MTPRHKLTRWDEWEIGETYSWMNLKNKVTSGVLQDFNRKECWVRINYIRFYDWRNKFRKVGK